jgi:uncharacterized protein YxeA
MEIIIYFILVIILIILGCNLLHKYYYIKNIESFDDFSPYLQNMSYPFVFQKNNDNKMLAKTLSNWERPFNCNDEGYYNAGFIPPLIQMKSYVGLKNKIFTVQ